MKRCRLCGRAADDISGLITLSTCPWCGGDLFSDACGPQSLSDAIEILYTIDPSWPYQGALATTNLLDLAPNLKRERRHIGVAAELGVLAMLQEGRLPAARRALSEEGWSDKAVEIFVEAYVRLEEKPAPTSIAARRPKGGEEKETPSANGQQTPTDSNMPNNVGIPWFDYQSTLAYQRWPKNTKLLVGKVAENICAAGALSTVDWSHLRHDCESFCRHPDDAQARIGVYNALFLQGATPEVIELVSWLTKEVPFEVAIPMLWHDLFSNTSDKESLKTWPESRKIEAITTLWEVRSYRKPITGLSSDSVPISDEEYELAWSQTYKEICTLLTDTIDYHEVIEELVARIKELSLLPNSTGRARALGQTLVWASTITSHNVPDPILNLAHGDETPRSYKESPKASQPTEDESGSFSSGVSSNKQDENRAVNLLRAEQLFKRGQQHEASQGYEEAARCYETAAKLGHKEAEDNLARLHRDEGVTMDHADSIKWNTIVAERGDIEAQTWLARQYREGIIGAPDWKEAVKWYLRAAEKEDVNSQSWLGYCYEYGKGVPTIDVVKAAHWYRRAAKSGDIFAQKRLGALYYEGREPELAKDRERSAKWYRMAAEKGDRTAQCWLATLCREDGDWIEAVVWYKRSAKQGAKNSQSWLGYCYENGKGNLATDPEKAKEWYRQAAKSGDGFAQGRLEVLERSSVEQSLTTNEPRTEKLGLDCAGLEGLADDQAKRKPYCVSGLNGPYANVGRNDPCPCGSGKKFKNCHGRHRVSDGSSTKPIVPKRETDSLSFGNEAMITEASSFQHETTQSITDWIRGSTFQYGEVQRPSDYGLLSLDKVREVLGANADECHIRWHDEGRQRIDIRFRKAQKNRATIVVDVALRSKRVETVSYMESPALHNAFANARDAIYDLVGYLNRGLLLGSYLVDEPKQRITFWCPLDCPSRQPTKEQLENCIYEGYEQISDSYSQLWNTALGYTRRDAIRKMWGNGATFGVAGESGGSPQLVAAVEEALRRNSLKFSKGFLSRPPRRTVDSFEVYPVGTLKATFYILDWGILADYLLPPEHQSIMFYSQSEPVVADQPLSAESQPDYDELNRRYIKLNQKNTHGSFEVDRRDKSVHYRAFLDLSEEKPDFMRISKFISDSQSDIRNASDLFK